MPFIKSQYRIYYSFGSLCTSYSFGITSVSPNQLCFAFSLTNVSFQSWISICIRFRIGNNM